TRPSPTSSASSASSATAAPTTSSCQSTSRRLPMTNGSAPSSANNGPAVAVAVRSGHGRKDELTMALITRSQVINATVDEVFDVIVDGASFAAWNPTVRSSRRLDSGQVGNGTRFEWELRGFGKVIQELQ